MSCEPQEARPEAQSNNPTTTRKCQSKDGPKKPGPHKTGERLQEIQPPGQDTIQLRNSGGKITHQSEDIPDEGDPPTPSRNDAAGKTKTETSSDPISKPLTNPITSSGIQTSQISLPSEKTAGQIKQGPQIKGRPMETPSLRKVDRRTLSKYLTSQTRGQAQNDRERGMTTRKIEATLNQSPTNFQSI